VSLFVRAASEADLPTIAAIHNRAITETTTTWLWEPIGLPARRQWFAEQARAGRPVFVAEVGGTVAGFASYGPFRAYAGYRDTVENSVYVDQAAHQRGIGRALMEALITAARVRKMHAMVAAIALPNDASVALHRRLGFFDVGIMPQVGLKFGRYHDLLLMQKML
jgi:L-amino acid N-acyltransferase YncA